MHTNQFLLLTLVLLVVITSAAKFDPVKQVSIANNFPRHLKGLTPSEAVDIVDNEDRFSFSSLNRPQQLKLKFRGWLSNGDTPPMVLDNLQALKIPLNKKVMMSWFKYSLKYAAVQGEDNVAASYTNIFKAMTKRVPEEEVPLLLVAMMKDPKLDKLFRTFQARQYKTWKGQGWSSNDVKKVLRVQTLGKTLDELKKDNAYLFWQGYVRELAKK